MAGASLFPLRELLIICKGCGGERQVPEEQLATILSVDDFQRFTKGALALYACRCGSRTCDLRMLPSESASEDLKRRGGA